MGMNVAGGAVNGPIAEINTTPLIDVMLCVLITIIYSVPVMTHAVKLDMPQVPKAPQISIPPQVIELEIDFDGTLVWNGATIPGIDALESPTLRSAASQAVQPELHLQPDRRAKYEVVAKVLAAAQRNRLEEDRVRRTPRSSGTVLQSSSRTPPTDRHALSARENTSAFPQCLHQPNSRRSHLS